MVYEPWFGPCQAGKAQAAAPRGHPELLSLLAAPALRSGSAETSLWGRTNYRTYMYLYL